jgi:hypothetical protein
MKGKKRKKKFYNNKPKFQSFKTSIDASGYVLFNPKFDILVVTQLLPKNCTKMIIKGTTEDFKDDPQQVFRIVNEDPLTKISLGAPNNG